MTDTLDLEMDWAYHCDLHGHEGYVECEGDLYLLYVSHDIHAGQWVMPICGSLSKVTKYVSERIERGIL